MAKNNNINKLPAVNRTPVMEKLFSSTIDQLSSEQERQYFQAYIGQRPGSVYDNTSDYYKPELSKFRHAYQLEPGVISGTDTSTTPTDIKSYMDFLAYLQRNGGNIENHERLFESDEYVWSPPIDVDKFVNHTWYYWFSDLYNNMPAIKVSDLTDVDIAGLIGSTSLTLAGFEMLNGMVVEFTNIAAGDYAGKKFIVEGIGSYVEFIEVEKQVLPVDPWEYLPWDENATKIGVETRGTPPNTYDINIYDGPDGWDTNAWDAIESVIGKDYITIERGAKDKNPWSRTNGWLHIDSITAQQKALNEQEATELSLFTFAERASMPIIEFTKDIELYHTGSNWLRYVDNVLSVDSIGTFNPKVDNVFVLRSPIDAIAGTDYTTLSESNEGSRIWHDDNLDRLKAAANSRYRGRDNVFRVISRSVDSQGMVQLDFEPVVIHPELSGNNRYRFLNNDIVTVRDGELVADRGKDLFWYVYEATEDRISLFETESELRAGLLHSGQQKYDVNQDPLFSLYNSDSLENRRIEDIPNVIFSGSKLFSYKVNEFSSVLNTEVGKYLTYTGIGQITDIVFSANLDKDRIYVQSDTESVEIPGYYYFKRYPTARNGFTSAGTYENFWSLGDKQKQPIVDQFVATDDLDTRVLTLSLVPEPTTVDIEINGERLSPDVYSVVNDQVFIDAPTSANDNITIKSRSVKTKLELKKILLSQTDYQLIHPVNYSDEVSVFHNGTKLNSSRYRIVNKRTLRFGNFPDTAQDNDTIFIQYESDEVLKDNTSAFYEVPSTLETNYNNEDVVEASVNDLMPHFLSILATHTETGAIRYGQKNQYFNSSKDVSGGKYIRQSSSNLLSVMLTANSKDMPIIPAMKQAGGDYVRFKNKFTKAVKDLSDSGDLTRISQSLDLENTSVIDRVFNEAVTTVLDGSVSYNTYNNTYMFPFGSVYEEFKLSDPTVFRRSAQMSEGFVKYDAINPTLTDISGYDDTRSTLIIIEKLLDSNAQRDYGFAERVLTEGDDYVLFGTDVYMRERYDPDTYPSDPYYRDVSTLYRELTIRVYRNLESSRIPATPSTLGLYPVFKPRYVYDESIPYPGQAPVTPPSEFNKPENGYILGHDGSKTPVYGDVRDQLLLELEKRIYNNIRDEYKENSLVDGRYTPPLLVNDIVPNQLRKTEFSRKEINEILVRPFNTWTTDNGIQWRENAQYQEGNEWTYNYDAAKVKTNMPNSWRGMYRYRYGTTTPHLTPWECLGFADRPSDWTSLYGTDYSARNTAMWDEITGVTNVRLPKSVKLGFTEIPVDDDGNLKTPYELGLVNDPALVKASTFTRDWNFGDGSPAEESWRMSSIYPFEVMRLMLLTKPAKFSDLMWDTVNITASSRSPEQIVFNETGKRVQRADLVVHGEVRDGEVVSRYGYQQWLSDYLDRNNKDVSELLGQKVRNARVQLVHKMGGFTVPENTTYKTSSINVSGDGANLNVPSENIDTVILDSEVYDVKAYSGIIVRKVRANTFRVYGYDVQSPWFKYYGKLSDARSYTIQGGGEDAPFSTYTEDKQYNIGSIIERNGTYYRAKSTHYSQVFDPTLWTALSELPKINAVSAQVYPDRDSTSELSINYGHEFTSVQDLVDFMIGYGAYLNDIGFDFEERDPVTSARRDFVQSSKQLLNWIASNWENNSLLALSPISSKVSVTFDQGYPVPVVSDKSSEFVVLNKAGLPLSRSAIVFGRTEKHISLETASEDAGIFFARFGVKDSEHVVVFDNKTVFDDVMFDGLLQQRKKRIIFDGFRSFGWSGKKEAPGYIITESGSLITNLENNTSSIRDYHNSESVLDRSGITNAARHMIGYDSKDYLTTLGLGDNAQYEFYRGMIQEKGTVTSSDKILRALDTDASENITINEEWAVKVGDFGATNNTQRFDILLSSEKVVSDPQAVLIDTPVTDHKKVHSIEIVDLEEFYATPPHIRIIPAPDDTGHIVWATAKCELSEDGRISDVTLVSSGEGYTKTPTVIVARSDSFDIGGFDTDAWDDTDIAWEDDMIATLEGLSDNDSDKDNIIVVDQDSVDSWHRRPVNTSPVDLFPKTDVIDYDMPTAGYVHIRDVNYTAFNVEQVFDYNSEPAIPSVNYTYDSEGNESVESRDTLWLARNAKDDWDVLRATELLSQQNSAVFKSGNTWYLETDVDLYDVFAREVTSEAFVLYSRLVTVDPSLDTESPRRNIAEKQVLIKPVLDETSEKETSYARRYALYRDLEGTDLTTADTVLLENADIDELDEFAPVLTMRIICFESCRFDTRNDMEVYSANSPFLEGELAWVDHAAGENDWAVYQFQGNVFVPYEVQAVVNDEVQTTVRQRETLVNTHLFDQAFLYDEKTAETLFLLPVYDPFKGLLPTVVEQNVTWRMTSDPAKYTNSDVFENVDLNNLFDQDNIGQVWWDTSKMAYLYYEQGSIYERRDYWGAVFPGSEAAVYEWIESDVPPSQYSGSGTPRNVNEYTQREVYNSATKASVIKYYFWVAGKTTIAGSLPNRTASVFQVASMILTPTKQNYIWFSPINDHKNDVDRRHRYVEVTTDYETGNFIDLGADWISDVRVFRLRDGKFYGDGHNWRVVKGGLEFDSVLEPNETFAISYQTSSYAVDGNSFVFANVSSVARNRNTAFQINYKYKETHNQDHTEWVIINEDGSDTKLPEAHWEKFIDSFTGITKPTGWDEVKQGLYNLREDGFAYTESKLTTGNVTSLLLDRYDTRFPESRGVIELNGERIYYNTRVIVDADGNESKYGKIKLIGLDRGYQDTDVVEHPVDSYVRLVYETSPDVPSQFVGSYTSSALPDLPTQIEAVTGAKSTDSYLMVPDPSLGDYEKYGNANTPRQSWFKDVFAARKVIFQDINENIKNLRIRSDYPEWNLFLAEQEGTLWQWGVWYADGYSAENVNPTRLVKSPSELSALKSRLVTGDQVRVQPVVNANYTVYEVNSTGSFEIVAVQNETVEILPRAWTGKYSHQLRLELRLLMDLLREYIFVGDTEKYMNSAVFTAFVYVMSEQDHVDWLFKTSYVSVRQTGNTFDTPAITTPNNIELLGSYIEDVKPYRTKIRNFSSAYTVNRDDDSLVEITGLEDIVTTTTININRVWSESVSDIPPNDGSVTSLTYDEASFDRVNDVNAGRVYAIDSGEFGSFDENDPGLMSASDAGYMHIEYMPEMNQTFVVEFDVTTQVVDVMGPFVFVNGREINMFNYDATEKVLRVIVPLHEGDIVEIYDVRPSESRSFANPMTRDDLMSGIAPIEVHDALVVTVETNPSHTIEYVKVTSDNLTLADVDSSTSRVYVARKVPRYNVSPGVTTEWIVEELTDFFNNVRSEPWDEFVDGEYVHGWDSTPWDTDASITFDNTTIPINSWLVIVSESSFSDTNYAYRYLLDETSDHQVFVMGNASATVSSSELPSNKYSVKVEGDYTNQGNTGRFWINGEMVSYSNIAYDGTHTTFYGLKRGQLSTSIANHAPGSRIQFVSDTQYVDPDVFYTGDSFEFDSGVESFVKSSGAANPITYKYL